SRRRAISRTPTFCARSSAISSRSENDRYRPEGGERSKSGIPPECLNQRDPTAGDTPQAAAASSVDSPFATSTQNRRSNSRLNPGRPGENISGLPVCAAPQPFGLPTQHLHLDGCCYDRLNSPWPPASEW